MRIIITGAAGIIGKVLMRCLKKKYQILGIDKKSAPGILKLDILKQPDKFEALLKKDDVVIHLAWDTKHSGATKNITLTKLVLHSSFEKKAAKIILASSVHVVFGYIDYQRRKIVKDHSVLHRKKKIKITDEIAPISQYGRLKVRLEKLGELYAQKGLRIITVRFGNVTPDNGHGEYPFWLSHKDLCQFIEKCCAVKNLPRYSVFFAISNNECNPFDILTAKRWLNHVSRDGSSCLLT